MHIDKKHKDKRNLFLVAVKMHFKAVIPHKFAQLKVSQVFHYNLLRKLQKFNIKAELFMTQLVRPCTILINSHSNSTAVGSNPGFCWHLCVNIHVLCVS
jgi:hypothetical protein